MPFCSEAAIDVKGHVLCRIVCIRRPYILQYSFTCRRALGGQQPLQPLVKAGVGVERVELRVAGRQPGRGRQAAGWLDVSGGRRLRPLVQSVGAGLERYPFGGTIAGAMR